MQTGMLGYNEALRRLWDGLLKDLVLKLNSPRGPEYEEGLRKLLRDELMPIPVSAGTSGITIVKTVTVMIGGGRTTDQIIEAAKKSEGRNKPSYIDSDITQANIPSGHGRRRPVVLEFFEFDHDLLTEEVMTRCEEPGYGYPTCEDGLRFQEDRPDDQREHPHIFIPENPWCGADGPPRALYLWSNADDRKLSLSYCRLDGGWYRARLFARRKSC